MQTEKAKQEHLFISYASEDWVLADWLALKLASEGYKVWYDRLKLLGGESYPRDITEAIKYQTFRVIALLSRNSINKPNPVKERTLSLNIAKERNNDFIIPINVDGLKPTELDFMTSDLVYIPFDRSWFDGLSSLLKKLEQIAAPKNMTASRGAISSLLSAEEQPQVRSEVLWSNLLPILEIPSVIRRYNIVPEIDVESLAPDWPSYWESEDTLWAFGPPETSSFDWLEELSQYDFRMQAHDSESTMKNILSSLLRHRVEHHCLNKGLNVLEDSGRLYFPNNLIPGNRLYFTRYDGKKVNIRVVGERKFRTLSQGQYFVEMSRYHLSPNFKFFIDMFGGPIMRLRIGVFWTDMEGHPLESLKANRRRKALCKDWWNYEWLSRTMAIAQWLGEGREEVTLLKTDSGDFRIGLKPISFHSDVGIGEISISADQEEDESVVLVDADEEEEDATAITV